MKAYLHIEDHSIMIRVELSSNPYLSQVMAHVLSFGEVPGVHPSEQRWERNERSRCFCEVKITNEAPQGLRMNLEGSYLMVRTPTLPI